MKIHTNIEKSLGQKNKGTLQDAVLLLLGLCLVWFGAASTAWANPGYLGQRKTGVPAEELYKRHCSVCHGDRGNATTKASNSLVTPPRDFSSAKNLTRKKMIFAIENGKGATAMMGWKTRLTQEEIESLADYIRGRFMLVALDPRIAQGRGVYGHFCQECHGDRGQGVISSQMDKSPPDLTTAKTQTGLTRDRMIKSITKGKHGPVKTGFGGKLTTEHIAATTDYIRRVLIPELSKSDPPYVIPDADESAPLAAAPLPESQQQPGASTPAPAAATAKKKDDMFLPMPKGLKGDAKLGEKFYMANCATCHGKKGDAEGPRAYFINPKVRNFQDDYSRSTLDRPTIFNSVTKGRPGTEMPAWGKVLDEQEVANVTEFVFKTFIEPNVGKKAAAK
ncbi:MAG: c-type cytochrome [Gallionellaceae bacterium]|nr:c-type cytochrome [Gallionellaceae bacterium]